MPNSFLVTGATGHQGGALARILLAQNDSVHALVRDPTTEKSHALEKQGAKIFKGGFDDVDVIKAAIAGVSGVFLNPFPTPQDPDLQIRQAQNVIDAAVQEGCPLVISTACLTAQKEVWQGSGEKDFLYLYYSRKYAIEAAIRDAKLRSYTIVRPAYLMHNYLVPFSNFHYPELSKEGVVKHMYEEGRKFGHLDSADVGRVVEVILKNPSKYDKTEIDLAVANLDADDAVDTIKAVSGRDDIRTERVVIEGKFDTVMKTGLTWHYFANMQNTAIANAKEVEAKFGLRLTTFKQYLEREKELLMKSLPELLN